MHPIESNIKKLLIIRILMSITFSTPIMVFFWQDHGMNMTEIMVLQSLFALCMVLFEIPTGYFADRMTRRMSIILSGFCLFLGYLIYGLSTGFVGFLIAEMILALGLSFLSGADSALLYETLLSLGRESEHTKLYGRNDFYMYIGIAIGQVIGPLLVGILSYGQIILLGVPFLFSAFCVSLTLREPDKHISETHTSSLAGLVSLFREHFHPSGKLFFVILYGSIVYGLMQSILWFYPPYFTLTNVPVAYFGVIFASFQIIAAFGSKYAHEIEKKIGKKYIFLISTGLITLSYIGMALFPYLWGFIFAYIHQIIRGYQRPIIATSINDLAPSQYRATLLSVQGLIGRLFYAIFIPGLGYIADKQGTLTGIWTLALLGGVSTLMLIFRR